MWKPEIDGKAVSDINQLASIIDREYACLKKYKIFNQLLSHAKCHLMLYQKLCKRQSLEKGEISRLARELHVKRLLVSAFITKAGRPRLYFYIQRCISKTKISTILRNLLRQTNGISSLSRLKERLETYFFIDALIESRTYSRHIIRCKKYFAALRELQEGGCYKAVSKTVKVEYSRVIWWLRGQKPYLVELASRIPKKVPKKGYRWLPTKMAINSQPLKLIEVPKQVIKWSQISAVIKKLRPLKPTDKALKIFGSICPESAFSYILGIMVSDASKHKDSKSSIRIALGLSKNYSWSKRVGNATCHYLGRLGIRAKRGKDTSSNKGDKSRYFWYSERSPLIKWINQACLGLNPKHNTTNQAIMANWLLDAPRSIQIKFLQGLNDGDGYASVKAKALGNACPPNTLLVKKILKGLDIDSKAYPDKLLIKRNQSIIKATNLPFFLHATERQNNAEKIVKMIKVRKKTGNTFDALVQQKIKKWSKNGLSSGAISERFFDETGKSFSITQIRYYVNKFREE